MSSEGKQDIQLHTEVTVFWEIIHLFLISLQFIEHLLHARQQVNLDILYLIYSLQTLYKVDAMPILQVRKLRLRKVNNLLTGPSGC